MIFRTMHIKYLKFYDSMVHKDASMTDLSRICSPFLVAIMVEEKRKGES